LFFSHLRRTDIAEGIYKPEEIVAKLRQVDVLASHDNSGAEKRD